MANRIRKGTFAEGMAGAKTLRRNGVAVVPQWGSLGHPGDISGCHTGAGAGAVTELWWVEAIGAVNPPAMHRRGPGDSTAQPRRQWCEAKKPVRTTTKPLTQGAGM